MRKHKGGCAATLLGDSVGKWEGDTLVIDTIGFKGSELSTIRNSIPSRGLRAGLCRLLRRTGNSWNTHAPPAIGFRRRPPAAGGARRFGARRFRDRNAATPTLNRRASS